LDPGTPLSRGGARMGAGPAFVGRRAVCCRGAAGARGSRREPRSLRCTVGTGWRDPAKPLSRHSPGPGFSSTAGKRWTPRAQMGSPRLPPILGHVLLGRGQRRDPGAISYYNPNKRKKKHRRGPKHTPTNNIKKKREGVEVGRVDGWVLGGCCPSFFSFFFLSRPAGANARVLPTRLGD